MRKIILLIGLFFVSSCTIEYKVVSGEKRKLDNRGSEDDDDLRVIKVYKFKSYELYQTKKTK